MGKRQPSPLSRPEDTQSASPRTLDFVLLNPISYTPAPRAAIALAAGVTPRMNGPLARPGSPSALLERTRTPLPERFIVVRVSERRRILD
jgi:hypothetical protein